MEQDSQNIFYVYAWFYKKSGKIFYIGKGKNDRCFERKLGRNAYFKNIVNKNQVSVKKLYENLSEKDALDLERRLIHEYWAKGECKANFHEGGAGGFTGKYGDSERSRKLSISAKKRVGSLNPNFGHHWTLEQRRAQSLKLKGRSFMTPEHKAKLIAVNTGRDVSDQTKQKLSKALKGRKMTPERVRQNFLSQIKYKYTVMDNNIIVTQLYSQKHLFKFFKINYNCSKPIVQKILSGNYIPTFQKHKALRNVNIIISDISEQDMNILKSESVSINHDECNGVGLNLSQLEVRNSQETGDDMISTL